MSGAREWIRSQRFEDERALTDAYHEELGRRSGIDGRLAARWFEHLDTVERPEGGVRRLRLRDEDAVAALGAPDVLGAFETMKDGAIVCNTGHYDCEINLEELEAMAQSKRTIRENCEEYTMSDGRRIYILAQGRLVNLAAAEGHPSEVMDMSFANQALAAEHLLKKGKRLENKVYPVPAAIDEMIAKGQKPEWFLNRTPRLEDTSIVVVINLLHTLQYYGDIQFCRENCRS